MSEYDLSQPFEALCPQCGRKIKFTLAQFPNGSAICLGCSVAIPVKKLANQILEKGGEEAGRMNDIMAKLMKAE
ncbi:MAG: hypothetical protein LBC90_02415 [Candidatus Adiutrix sp.]|jgi:hypothetical protein|nr:hypothetical protein [Candidatus Adiutrix sp.]